MRTLSLLLGALAFSCTSQTKQRSLADYDVTLPAECPEYVFRDFEEPYGVLYCEVYIGCFGALEHLVTGETAETVPECLEMTCGNGGLIFAGESECVLDESLSSSCLEEMTRIADALGEDCPNQVDAWFPSVCGMAVDCADE